MSSLEEESKGLETRIAELQTQMECIKGRIYELESQKTSIHYAMARKVKEANEIGFLYLVDEYDVNHVLHFLDAGYYGWIVSEFTVGDEDKQKLAMYGGEGQLMYLDGSIEEAWG